MGTGVPALHDRLALRMAMVEFIEEHLNDSDLSVEAVAQHHHVSLRLAQQVFAEAGDGIAGHVRTRRLERARMLLDGGATVADAGRRVGFGDLGTFTRAFKSSNGLTPRAYSAMMRAQPVTSGADLSS